MRTENITEYGGISYRTRLDAKWAYFFDLVGINHQYVTDGFEMDYIPSFYLPDRDAYAYVESDVLEYHKDLVNRILPILEAKNSPIRRLIVLGNIPDSDEAEGVYWYPVFYFHPLQYQVLREYKALIWEDEEGDNADFKLDWDTECTANDYYYTTLNLYEEHKYLYNSNRCTIGSQKLDPVPDEEIEPRANLRELGTLRVLFPSSKLVQAYALARQARFDDGFTPTNVNRI